MVMRSAPDGRLGHRWERVADATPSVLDQLCELESPEPVDEDADEILPFLQRLPEREAAYLGAWLAGASQRQIAGAVGLSYRAVRYRVQRGLRRIAWMRGPGAWFTGRELRRAAELVGLSDRFAAPLVVWWETTSCLAVEQAHSLPHSTARQQVRIGHRQLTIGALQGRISPVFGLGLGELDAWGGELLAARGSSPGSSASRG
jgi:hypothetical protein